MKTTESATFQVRASGGYPDNYIYQWYYAESQISAGIKIEGATESTYTIPSGQVTASLNGRYYYCVVSNGAYEVESGRAKLTVYSDLESTENKPAAGNIPSGGNQSAGSISSGSNSSNGASAGSASGNSTIQTQKAQKITASSYKKEYGSKSFSLKAKTTGDGKLTYKSSNKKVATISSKGKVTLKNCGTATITINAAKTSKYKAASAKVTIKVIPKKATLTKATAIGSRKVNIKWKKSSDINGYEMYISRKSSFKSETFKRVYKKNQTNVTLTGLQEGKTYYVKICTYKKVGKKTYYGNWSKIKKVKIK